MALKPGDRIEQTVQGKRQEGRVTKVADGNITVSFTGADGKPYEVKYGAAYADANLKPVAAQPQTGAATQQQSGVAQTGVATGARDRAGAATGGGGEGADPEDELRKDLIGRYNRGEISLDVLTRVAGMIGDSFVGLRDLEQRAELASALARGDTIGRYIQDATAYLADKKETEAERQFERDYKLSVLDPMELELNNPLLGPHDYADLRLTYLRLATFAPRILSQYQQWQSSEAQGIEGAAVFGMEQHPASVTDYIAANLPDIFAQVRPDIRLDAGQGQDVWSKFVKGVLTVANIRRDEREAADSFRDAFSTVQGKLLSEAASAPAGRSSAIFRVMTAFQKARTRLEKAFIPLGVAGQDPNAFLDVALAQDMAIALASDPEASAFVGAQPNLWPGLQKLFSYESASDAAARVAGEVEKTQDAARQTQAKLALQRQIDALSGWTTANGYTPAQVARANAEIARLEDAATNLPTLALQNPTMTAQQLAASATGQGVAGGSAPLDPAELPGVTYPPAVQEAHARLVAQYGAAAPTIDAFVKAMGKYTQRTEQNPSGLIAATDITTIAGKTENDLQDLLGPPAVPLLTDAQVAEDARQARFQEYGTPTTEPMAAPVRGGGLSVGPAKGAPIQATPGQPNSVVVPAGGVLTQAQVDAQVQQRQRASGQPYGSPSTEASAAAALQAAAADAAAKQAAADEEKRKKIPMVKVDTRVPGGIVR